MSEVLRIGLIGLGKMGQNHLRVLSMLKKVELVFIYDKDETLTESLAESYGVCQSRDVLSDLHKVDAVVIATPTSTHYEWIKVVAPFVGAIFAEKPLAASIEECKNIEKIISEKHIKLQVGYIERFNPAIIELKKVLVSNNRVINIDFIRTNKLSLRITDVDVILDLMIHDIDLAIYFNGEVKEVYAYGTVEKNMIVFAGAVLVHSNGTYSRLTASRVTEKRIRQIDATFENMYVDCNLLKNEIVINRQTVSQTYSQIFLSSIEEAVQVSKQEALLSEIIFFVDYALGNVELNEKPGISSALSSMTIGSEIQKQIWGKFIEI